MAAEWDSVSESCTGSLPDGIEVMAPDARLAAVVSDVDRDELSAVELLRVTRARLRLLAAMQAQVLADLHHVAHIARRSAVAA